MAGNFVYKKTDRKLNCLLKLSVDVPVLDTADMKELRKLQIIQQIGSSCTSWILIDINHKKF